jgi:mRNA interferase HicA
MDAAEFLRKVRRYARAHGLAVELDTSQGKGSHAMLYLGARRTALPQHAGREIGKGLLHSMLKDLGLTFRDL